MQCDRCGIDRPLTEWRDLGVQAHYTEVNDQYSGWSTDELAEIVHNDRLYRCVTPDCTGLVEEKLTDDPAAWRRPHFKQL